MLKKVLKWIGIVLGSLIGLLALALVVLFVVGGAKANKKYEIPVETVYIPTDAEAIQRGEHIATIYICTSCHTENLSGELYFAVPGMLSIPTPNLTAGAGGIGSFYTGEDWVRAIRHGVGHDGRALFIMPSNTFYYLSDEDLGTLIAYLKSVPPVDNVLLERRIELLGRLMMAVGLFPPLAVDRIDHTAPPPAVPEPGVTVAYGQYLSRICTECHGANLNGAPFGPPGQEVPTPNLTPGGELAAWSEEDFFTTLRTGLTPSGRKLNEEQMPWKAFGQMTDEELHAVWLYLRSLPALEQAE
jgi:mono/diheme cytochrome c family protein